MELSRQEYWSCSTLPSPGVLPNPGIKSCIVGSLLCCCLLLSHQGSSSCLCNPNSALPTFFLFPFIFAFPTELDFKKIIPYLVIFFSQRHIVALTLSHIKISINGYIYSYITYMQYMYACFITYAICMCVL